MQLKAFVVRNSSYIAAIKAGSASVKITCGVDPHVASLICYNIHLCASFVLSSVS
ncbi:15995_t:CDS:1, partial [Dentiscutata erythropus]